MHTRLLALLTMATVNMAVLAAAAEPQAARKAIRISGHENGTRPGALERAAPGAVTDSPETVSVGYAPWSEDPDKVGVSGVWDFGADASGSDSTQFWTFIASPA